jgi:osmoprotectant transport system ATP-binding protein
MSETPTPAHEPRQRVPALEAVKVHHRFGSVVALDGVDLQVAAGECVALVGESGSGKTTLLRSFNRMVEPTGGEIRVGGVPVERLDPVHLRRTTGYVQQEGGLLPHWRVLRNVEMVPRLLGFHDASQRARRALTRVGLAPDGFGDRWPRELSGGQRQRVALARALAAEPGVVLLDEPFGALDAITRAEVQETFGALRQSEGLTAVLVTHDLREALTLADRIVVLRGGRVEQAATPGTLLAHPAPGYVTELLTRSGLRPLPPGGQGGTPWV